MDDIINMSHQICAYLFCMPNDEEYILYAIKSLLTQVDKIVITCPTKKMWQHRTNGMEITGQDRTIAYLEKAKAENPDIIHLVFKDGWGTPNDQWQAGFDKMGEIGMVDGDSFIISMPDEVWAEKDLKAICDLSRNGHYNYTPHKYDFFGNFEYCTRGGEGRNYRFEVGMSLDAVTKSCEFQYHRHPEYNQFLGRASLLKDVPVFHFTWCHNLKHFRQKAEWNNVFYSARARENPMDVLKRWMVNKETTNVKMNLDAAPIFTKKFEGDFPDLLKKHPYYGIGVNEVLAYQGGYEI